MEASPNHPLLISQLASCSSFFFFSTTSRNHGTATALPAM